MDVREVTVETAQARLNGDLVMPPEASGVVLFAHGSGSSRRSPRNQAVADSLHTAGFGTLLFDLLTEEEESVDRRTAELRFDIALLTRRLTGAVDWLIRLPETERMPIGLFGASTGAAAALGTAAVRQDRIGAVVSRGGRPDLAEEALEDVRAPVLLIVGSFDEEVIRINYEAAERLHTQHDVHLIPGATHLFEEPGTLEQMTGAAMAWFTDHLKGRAHR
ncbi:dienelactone hydrolase [Spinactinospora alkalitolerans]|uniref:Dienelactone hydrolase n=1 Tax=Spinactinospora alkalitolerans TaxID=687207 RepID=A0A852TWE2_9ACTN|nr:alpha/beta family hydrolase [Spinactinospora alkalitolerans]NYE48248.1 dienelactone hydrolase [Spinactinospora alkalitolerans]